MTDLKFEAGKFYRVKSDRRMIVYAVYDKCLHGAMWDDNWPNPYNPTVWESDGTYIDEHNVKRPELTIVAEWKEERSVTLWFNFYDDAFYTYTTEENAIKGADFDELKRKGWSQECLARKEITLSFTPGEGL